MRLFDNIAASDSAFVEGRRLPRITVRPKGVVPPQQPGNASQTPADASDETENVPPVRTAGLFDDIVPLAPQATGPVAGLTETQIPQMDPMTGMPMPAPQLAPRSPGLPLRPETRAPLKTPTADWADLRVMAPRANVPLAVPDPTARGEGFPTPPGPTALDRIKAATAFGFGDAPLGFSDENRAKYPSTYLTWQPLAAPLDFAWRAPGAAIGAISSAGAEIYKALGGTEGDTNRLERDLNILGQGAMVEGRTGARYNVGKPQAVVRPVGAAEFAAGAEELAQHKAAIESALSSTVPLRLQDPHLVEIAAALMADHGMPLDEALDRATMRLHAEEGTAEVGKIGDVIGKDAFNEAQRTPASPDLAQPAPGVGPGRVATKEQARPDGEHALGDSAVQGGVAATERARSGNQPPSPVADDKARAEGLTSDGDQIVARPPARPPDKAAAQSDRMNSEARESGPSSFEDKQQAAKTGDIAAVTRNALKGRVFEEEGLGSFNGTHADVKSQVSVRPYIDASGTLADFRVRLDAMSVNGKRALQLTDFKSSESAGYTRNQKKGYPLFEQYGGQVVGKSGDEYYPHGFQIQPTEVTTMRPSDFKTEK